MICWFCPLVHCSSWFHVDLHRYSVILFVGYLYYFSFTTVWSCKDLHGVLWFFSYHSSTSLSLYLILSDLIYCFVEYIQLYFIYFLELAVCVFSVFSLCRRRFSCLLFPNILKFISCFDSLDFFSFRCYSSSSLCSFWTIIFGSGFWFLSRF